jgi:three-Cys-motif partner protein
MSVPTELLWDRDPHTVAKHQMLSMYLQAWFPILCSRFQRSGVTYAEGFAGPGEYLDHSEGSPVIALRQALRSDVTAYQCPIRVLCIEKRGDRLVHLAAVVGRKFPNPSPLLQFYPIAGDCSTEFLPRLTEIGAMDGPIFANLDGWGVDTPFRIVERIGQCRSSEVLITFETQWFIRFASMDEVEAGDRVFGNTDWRGVVDCASPGQKRRFLIDMYLKRLNEASFPFTLTFELVDEGGHGLLLVFGTASDLGVEKMKDSMWKVDPVSGSRFRDPRDPNQMSFDVDKPNFAPLRRELLSQLAGGGRSIAELKRHALLHTIYRPAHAGQEINVMVRESKLDKGPGRGDAAIVSLPAQPSLL